LMTYAEKILAARMLRLAAREFGNHGCNDFDLVADGGMLAKEARDFRKRFHDWNGDPKEVYAQDNPGRTDLPDFAAMGFLADLLEEEGLEE
jgi:hypothetical protein